MSTIVRWQNRIVAIIFLAMGLSVGVVLGQSSTRDTTAARQQAAKPGMQSVKPRVTFVELGSVKCIPCKKMQPVMKSIESKYGNQIKVVFHDVWTDEGKPQAEVFKIKLIPTQVFLDESEREFFRHEGFYPESEIDKLLQKRGLKVQTGK
jgi:thioredoxin 1